MRARMEIRIPTRSRGREKSILRVDQNICGQIALVREDTRAGVSVRKMDLESEFEMKTLFAIPALRTAFLAGCVMTLGSTAMVAQDALPPPPPPPPPHGHGAMGARGAEMQHKHLEHMTKQLNLSTDQVSQIAAIQEDGRKQMMALREGPAVAGEDRHAKMMEMHEAEEGKIKAVLTDEQKAKFDAMMERRHERRHEVHAPAAPQ